MILPTSHTLPSQVLIICRQPVASGGSGDVFEGTLDGSKVCVKRVKVYNWDGLEAAKKVLCVLIVLLSPVADEADRHSTKRP